MRKDSNGILVEDEIVFEGIQHDLVFIEEEEEGLCYGCWIWEHCEQMCKMKHGSCGNKIAKQISIKQL